jgi:hypothetical protein
MAALLVVLVPLQRQVRLAHGAKHADWRGFLTSPLPKQGPITTGIDSYAKAVEQRLS